MEVLIGIIQTKLFRSNTCIFPYTAPLEIPLFIHVDLQKTIVKKRPLCQSNNTELAKMIAAVETSHETKFAADFSISKFEKLSLTLLLPFFLNSISLLQISLSPLLRMDSNALFVIQEQCSS